MKYTDCKSITENYWDNIQNIILDKDNWVWLDYHAKRVYYGREKSLNISSVPATLEEYLAFKKHFLSKGVKECWFRELKQYVDFYGRTPQGRKYYVTLALDERDFEHLLSERKKISKYFSECISKSIKYDKIKANTDGTLSNSISSNSVADLLISFANFLKNDSKLAK